MNYKYIYNGLPSIPEYWKPIIFEMLKKLDKEIRPKYIPLFVANLLYDLKHTILGYYYYSLIDDFEITTIKQKFGTLRIYGIFKDYENIINDTMNECNNTCEYCGQKHTQRIMVKGWVTNLCDNCQLKSKSNGDNNRISTGN